MSRKRSFNCESDEEMQTASSDNENFSLDLHRINIAKLNLLDTQSHSSVSICSSRNRNEGSEPTSKRRCFQTLSYIDSKNASVTEDNSSDCSAVLDTSARSEENFSACSDVGASTVIDDVLLRLIWIVVQQKCNKDMFPIGEINDIREEIACPTSSISSETYVPDSLLPIKEFYSARREQMKQILLSTHKIKFEIQKPSEQNIKFWRSNEPCPEEYLELTRNSNDLFKSVNSFVNKLDDIVNNSSSNSISRNNLYKYFDLLLDIFIGLKKLLDSKSRFQSYCIRRYGDAVKNFFTNGLDSTELSNSLGIMIMEECEQITAFLDQAINV